MIGQHTTDRRQLIEVSADDQEKMKLILYKTLASNLEIKKAYFYVQMTPSQTCVSPYLFDERFKTANFDPVPNRVNPYYTQIGTHRKVDLMPIIDKLTGIRCEENRFKWQLSLETVIINQDTEGYTNIRDDQAVLNTLTGNYSLQPTFDVVNNFSATPTAANEEQVVDFIYFKEALKRIQPQPMCVRIDELANNDQSFQFIAQPSGVVATVNGGQPLIIDRLDRFPELNIQFGHLVYKGTDNDYFDAVKATDPNGFLNNDIDPLGITDPQVLNRIDAYRNFKFLDYNQDWYNCPTPAPGVDRPTNIANRYTNPCNRGGVQSQLKVDVTGVAPPPAEAQDIPIRTAPLFSNQQASKILMRFSLSFVPLF